MGQEYLRKTIVTSQTPSPIGQIFHDPFDFLNGWSISGTGAGFAGVLSTTQAYNGQYSMKITTRPATPTIGDFVQAYKQISAFQAKKLRLSYYFSTDDHTVQTCKFICARGLAGESAQFEVQLNQTANTLQYRNSSNVLTTLTEFTSVLTESLFGRLEIVVDQQTGKWVSITYGGVTKDMSGVDSYQPGFGTGKVIHSLYLLCTTLTNALATTYIDALTLEAIS